MLGRKGLASRRGAGLEQGRRALDRRLAQEGIGDAEILALVIRRMDAGGIDEHVRLAVVDHRVVLPARFPKLVDGVHELVGDGVSLVMGHLAVEPEVTRRALGYGCDDVPAHPPLGQVIQRRHLAGEAVGLLVGGGDRQPEAEMLRHRRHGRHRHQRIVQRHGDGVAQGRVGTPPVGVVDAREVGDEQAVETAALQRLRRLDPVGEVLVAVRLAVGMAPQADRRVADPGDLERVQVHALHGGLPSRGR